MLSLNLIVAIFLIVAGTGLIYLSSPKQLWRKQSLSASARTWGAIMLLISLILLLGRVQMITAISMWATHCMVLLILWSYCGAVLKIRHKRNANE